MGDFKGNWLDWSSDITLATFWKEHFGRKYAECKGMFNVEIKKCLVLFWWMELSVFLCVYLYIYGIFLITVFLDLFHFYKCKFFPPTGLILRSFHQKIKLFSIQQFYQKLGFPLSLPQTHIKDTSGIFINEKIIIDVGGEALPDWNRFIHTAVLLYYPVG